LVDFHSSSGNGGSVSARIIRPVRCRLLGSVVANVLFIRDSIGYPGPAVG